MFDLFHELTYLMKGKFSCGEVKNAKTKDEPGQDYISRDIFHIFGLFRLTDRVVATYASSFSSSSSSSSS